MAEAQGGLSGYGEFGKGTAVIVPHVVVDEIDTKSHQTGDKKISRRARGVFRLLESVLEAGPEKATADDGTPVFITADEPGPARLPVPDDELVAAALRLRQAVAPRREELEHATAELVPGGAYRSSPN